ncbi:alpha/beta fold hydrolase [Rhizobium mongolense]|uniref:Pimeloyl-ACP methyl ester carboxylesterase n=2 Tax=Rhizobium mongolense TaxID=57676 RepID=A0ABR6IJE2_9HYPH|nr:alpha/beta hydrolase [Rhizobium mongolense]MBB4227982.1 pimeloyl-ACP methyl ester carboxylesterase [Rhizobium mongolense]TVZ64866.1 pimeloyl-ACP methyl ester carboxylesterase [Rhizobium mongolense USDA 1844]
MNRTSFARADVTLSVAETGDGEAFVFQHGLCGDAGQPAQVFPEGTAYRCITMECRGHGQSEAGPTDRFSIETFADDLVDLIQSSSLHKPVIGGISMGAAIALRVAVKHPELVGALVLARPAWLDQYNPANMHPNAFAGELLQSLDPSVARERFEVSETVEKLERLGPDNLASIRGFFGREPIDVTAALLRRISADGPGVDEDQIRRITVPTLVIGHEQDFVHPIDYARSLASWIPGARFVEITPKAESPEAYRTDFQEALATFLKEL